MARYRFGAGVADWVTVKVPVLNEEDEVLDVQIELAPETEIFFFDEEEGPITDLLDENESAITSVTTDADGRLPLFFGPDGITYMRAGVEGPEFVVSTLGVDREISTRLDEIAADIDDLDGVSDRITVLENYNSTEIQPALSSIDATLSSTEDAVDFLINETPKRGQVVLYATSSTLQSVAHNTDVYINWTTVPESMSGVWSGGSPSVINLPWPGIYQFSGLVWFTGQTGGTLRAARIFDSSDTLIHSTHQVCGSQSLAVSVNMGRTFITSDGTESFKIAANQNTGSTVSTPASNSNPTFYNSICVIYRGPTMASE